MEFRLIKKTILFFCFLSFTVPALAKIPEKDSGLTDPDKRVTLAVRQALRDRLTLTVMGKDIRVVTRDGAVYLFGTVAHESVKSSVEAAARGAAPASYEIKNRIHAEEPRKKSLLSRFLLDPVRRWIPWSGKDQKESPRQADKSAKTND